jgi:hypothetical protein
MREGDDRGGDRDDESPAGGEGEHLVGHIQLLHVERSEELDRLILREVLAQVISNIIVLSADVFHNRVELELHNKIKKFSQEGGHLRI